MKRIIIITTVLLTTTVFGQQNKIGIGFETGPGLVILRENNPTGRNYPWIGFSGGLSFQYNFPKIFSLRTGFAFEQKGGLVDEVITTTDGYAVAQAALPNQFNYAIVPLMLRAGLGKKIKYFVNAGAFAGYLVRQTVVYENLEIIPSFSNADHTNRYKNLDAGIIAGAGIEFPIKQKFAFSLELRNNYGLVNVNKGGPSIKTNSTNLLIGFAYKLS